MLIKYTDLFFIHKRKLYFIENPIHKQSTSTLASVFILLLFRLVVNLIDKKLYFFNNNSSILLFRSEALTLCSCIPMVVSFL